MLLLSQTKGLGAVQPQVASSEVPIRPQKKRRPSLCGTNAVIQQLYSTMYFWMIDIRVLFRHNTQLLKDE